MFLRKLRNRNKEEKQDGECRSTCHAYNHQQGGPTAWGRA